MWNWKMVIACNGAVRAVTELIIKGVNVHETKL